MLGYVEVGLVKIYPILPLSQIIKNQPAPYSITQFWSINFILRILMAVDFVVVVVGSGGV